MRGRIREYPYAAGGEDLLPLLILHGEHCVREASAERAHIRLALEVCAVQHDQVRHGIAIPALAGDLSCNVHRGDGAADRKDRNRRIVLQVPAAARRGCDADEGANLEAALTGVALRVGIRIRQKRPLVIAHPAIEQLPIPGLSVLCWARWCWI